MGDANADLLLCVQRLSEGAELQLFIPHSFALCPIGKGVSRETSLRPIHTGVAMHFKRGQLIAHKICVFYKQLLFFFFFNKQLHYIFKAIAIYFLGLFFFFSYDISESLHVARIMISK